MPATAKGGTRPPSFAKVTAGKPDGFKARPEAALHLHSN